MDGGMKDGFATEEDLSIDVETFGSYVSLKRSLVMCQS